ncbi:hypothetical protein NPIL_53841 [Nephila pilipes]|uniref:Uncharacterized protein n=1 Tax=Nephila pilipes TaxID=299642 RepID=A0A8X6TYN2_NEPPI|nr:hypothetical protein NPIL_53841 [Nephila pilipes]
MRSATFVPLSLFSIFITGFAFGFHNNKDFYMSEGAVFSSSRLYFSVHQKRGALFLFTTADPQKMDEELACQRLRAIRKNKALFYRQVEVAKIKAEVFRVLF